MVGIVWARDTQRGELVTRRLFRVLFAGMRRLASLEPQVPWRRGRETQRRVHTGSGSFSVRSNLTLPRERSIFL